MPSSVLEGEIEDDLLLKFKSEVREFRAAVNCAGWSRALAGLRFSFPGFRSSRARTGRANPSLVFQTSGRPARQRGKRESRRPATTRAYVAQARTRFAAQ